MLLMILKFISPAWTSLLNSRPVFQSVYWILLLGCLTGISNLTCPKLTPLKPSSYYSIIRNSSGQLHGSDHSGQITWSHHDSTISLKKKIYLFFFLERREGERERNINVWLPLARHLLAHNPGMCPDWESNQ